VAFSDLFNLSGVLDKIKSLLGPFGQLWDKLTLTYTHMTNIFSSGEKLTQSVISEVNAWRNFKQDIRFKSRVVQIESAVEKTRALIEGIPAAWRSIVDLFKQFKEQLGGEGNPIEEADAATADIEAGGIKTLLTKFPALAKGLEKVLGFLAIAVQALEAITNAIDDLQSIVDEITRLRLEIEKLDTIFLSQSNKRKTLKLADGSSIRVRIGKLHS
jgi:hypothetical protein